MSDPDPVAQMDQALRGAQDSARLAYAIYSSLLKVGFDKTQAFELTLAWYKSSMVGMLQQG